MKPFPGARPSETGPDFLSWRGRKEQRGPGRHENHKAMSEQVGYDDIPSVRAYAMARVAPDRSSPWRQSATKSLMDSMNSASCAVRLMVQWTWTPGTALAPGA